MSKRNKRTLTYDEPTAQDLDGTQYPIPGYQVKRGGLGYEIYDVDGETKYDGVHIDLVEGRSTINIHFRYSRSSMNASYPSWSIDPSNGQSPRNHINDTELSVLYWFTVSQSNQHDSWTVTFTDSDASSRSPKTPKFIVVKKPTADSR